MTIVNFDDAEEFALGNLVKEVCDYWNNKKEWESTYTIAKKLNLARNTITNYLKRGVKHGWCYYDPKEESRKGSLKGNLKAKETLSKQVEIFKDGISLGIFESCHELERQSEERFDINLLQESISSVCRGKYNLYKGFTFKYL